MCCELVFIGSLEFTGLKKDEVYSLGIGRVVADFNQRCVLYGGVDGSAKAAVQPNRCLERIACRHALPQ